MNTPLRSRRHLGALLIAAMAIGSAASPSMAQEPPDDRAAQQEPVPGLPVPDDLGVVHSWALVPGDGTLEAGERTNLSYELNPGDEVDDVITVFNFSNVDLSFRVYATDAFNDEDGTFQLLARDEEPVDVGSWFDLGLEGVSIPAGAQATFPITVRVPADARPGDHVGAVLASSEAVGTGPDGDVINLDRRTGTRVYLRVAGPLAPELAVEDLSTTYSPSLDPTGGSAEVRYTIVNRGNVRLAGTYRASVAGPFGAFRSSAATEEIPELLPGEEMHVTQAIDGVAATGLLFTDVDLHPQPFGDDAAELPPAGRSTFDFAIPFTLLAAVVVAGLLAYTRRAYLRHRADELVVEHRTT